LGDSQVFNFSANHLTLVSSTEYDRANLLIMKDIDTNRCYKIYDYSKSCNIVTGKVYCVSGKINSADKLYLILENFKEDRKANNKKYKILKVQSV
jgi:hypothetical protein